MGRPQMAPDARYGYVTINVFVPDRTRLRALVRRVSRELGVKTSMSAVTNALIKSADPVKVARYLKRL